MGAGWEAGVRRGGDAAEGRERAEGGEWNGDAGGCGLRLTDSPSDHPPEGGPEGRQMWPMDVPEAPRPAFPAGQ